MYDNLMQAYFPRFGPKPNRFSSVKIQGRPQLIGRIFIGRTDEHKIKMTTMDTLNNTIKQHDVSLTATLNF